MQSLAEIHLSSEELASLHLKSDTLLDYHAGRAYDLLQGSGLTLPDWVAEWAGWAGWAGWLVYASIEDNCEMADLLWHGGFKDVDEADIQGSTSLMFCASLKFADWLISHGADIHRRVWGIPALHLMAGKLVLNYKFLTNLDKTSLRIINLFIQDKSPDACDCLCSLAGCFAITHLLCNAIRYFSGAVLRKSLISRLFWQLEEDPSFQVAIAFIRFLTFEVLQIPHTSCHPDDCWWTELGYDYHLLFMPFYHLEPKDQEEIDEIHDEWREQIAQLEALVTEFQVMYETSSLSFCEFLEIIWWGEMDKLDKKDDPPSQDEVRRVRELGVILDEVEEDSP